MNGTTVPGMKAEHAIITSNCRQVQDGDLGAFDVAVKRLRREYLASLSGWSKGDKVPRYHLVLTVEEEK